MMSGNLPLTNPWKPGESWVESALRESAIENVHLVYDSSNYVFLADLVHPEHGKGLGIYGKAAVTDGNPNPIKTSFIGGLAGHRIVPGRPHDSFGIGYFRYDFSDDLKSAVQPLLNIDAEQGIEVFYSLAVTPWFRVAADLQWIQPASGDNDDAWVGGLRANVRF